MDPIPTKSAKAADPYSTTAPRGPRFPRGRKPLFALAGAIVVATAALLVVRGRPPRVSGVARTTTTGLAVLPGPPGSVITLPPDTTTIGVATTVTTAAVHPTTIPVATVAACAPADLRTVTATDRGAYAPGDTVTVAVTVTDVSAHPCRIDQSAPATPVAIERDAVVVWQPAPAQSGAIVNSPRLLPPGGSYQWALVVWDQRACVAPCSGGGPPVASGSYLAVAANPPSGSPPAAFTISP
jgi:hypothetical protein